MPMVLAWWRFAVLGALLHGAAALAGFMEPKDLAKMGLWWAVAGSALWLGCGRIAPRAQRLAGLSLTLLFALDIATQGVVRGYFGTDPQPGVIAESLANTTAGEAAGFLQEQAGAIARGLGFTLLALALAWVLLRQPPSARARPRRRWSSLLLAGLVGLAALLHFNPAMLRQQPLLRWGVVYARHLQAEREIRGLDAARAQVAAGRASWQLRRLDDAPRTVVLVLGESDNRLNWGALGYGRDTTAALTRALATLPGRSVLFSQGWSAEAFTLPSLRLALTPATLATAGDWQRLPDITQLAQAAGYQVGWLSNQPAHEGWFAAMAKTAQRQRFVNAGNWRDSNATDHDLLPPLRDWLATPPPPHEFIVLHLLGQHFHFRQRCPAGMHPWREVHDDAVMQQLRQAGRSASIRQARNDYDDAVSCGASVLGQVLQLLHQQRPGRAVDLLYFSDHGQEVGHQRNFAGHSLQDAAGYAVPMLWWSRTADGGAPPAAPAGLAERPFRLDTIDQALQHLLRIETRWYQASQDVLAPAYQAPPQVAPQGLARR
ncbi:MAG: phosphoethanolamine transferase [Pseudomonadota bacterium]